jgi:hypothetical protein
MSKEGEQDDVPSAADEPPPADATPADDAASPDDAITERPAAVDRDAVATTFVSAAPLTLPEVVDESGLERENAELALDALVEDGELAEKTLRSGAASLRVWYLPASAHVERLASGTPDPERTDAVEETIATLDVPGVSEMMQDWRRDAIRSAWEYIAEHGAATDAAVIDAVYPGHSAGYDDREQWWECVRPRLSSLPGVTQPSEGSDDVWTYVPA